MPDARILPVDTTNHACVSFTGGGVVICNPGALRDRERAIVAAAYILTGLGVTPEEFRRYYDAVANA